VLQVLSSELVCCGVEDQSLILSVMSILLSNATNLITVRVNNATSYDIGDGLLDGYPYAANFSLTASSSTYSPVLSLQDVRDLPQGDLYCIVSLLHMDMSQLMS